jgi:hypothetical protein
MKCWINASAAEKLQYKAISVLFKQSLHLLKFLFDPDCPKLRFAPEEVLIKARGLCSGDYLLVKLAVDLWCGCGDIRVHELFDVDSDIFPLILDSLQILGPKPSELGLAMDDLFKNI